MTYKWTNTCMFWRVRDLIPRRPRDGILGRSQTWGQCPSPKPLGQRAEGQRLVCHSWHTLLPAAPGYHMLHLKMNGENSPIPSMNKQCLFNSHWIKQTCLAAPMIPEIFLFSLLPPLRALLALLGILLAKPSSRRRAMRNGKGGDVIATTERILRRV